MTLRDQIARDEGLRLMPYKDTEGFLTIGYGRCLDRVGISAEEAEYLLDNDVEEATAAVTHYLPWAADLSEPRFAVLVNMAFNLGIHGLLRFRQFLAAAKDSDWTTAAAEMLDSTWARQVGARAVRLAQQMETDAWQ